jgi:RNA polymerase sigma factor (sigma-70 family)
VSIENEASRETDVDVITLFLRDGNANLTTTQQQAAVQYGKVTGIYSNELFESFRDSVIKVARRYWSSGVHTADLVQAANLRLLTELGKYDPERGTIATFVSNTSRYAMADAIPELAFHCYIPPDAWNKHNQLGRESGNAAQEHKKDPYEAEKAAIANLPEKTRESINAVKTVIGGVSMETLEDEINPNSTSPEDQALLSLLMQSLCTRLTAMHSSNQISDNQFEIFIQYFINGKTLGQIAEENETTKSAVSKAFRRLKVKLHTNSIIMEILEGIAELT